MSSKLFTTRQGTILLGVIAAVIAAVALIVYLNSYRNSVNATATGPVVIATHLIEKGTSGEVIAANGLGKVSQDFATSNIKAGAITDPATLTGEVAVRNIYAGQQLTAADFVPANGSIALQLGPKMRAVTFAMGSPAQVGGQITAGSHVDVWARYQNVNANGQPIIVSVAQDVYVLAVNGQNVTMRATARQAGQLIYANGTTGDEGDLYLALRPTVATNLPKQLTIGSIGGVRIVH
jgi:Flp pilus assembly protein CpaB